MKVWVIRIAAVLGVIALLLIAFNLLTKTKLEVSVDGLKDRRDLVVVVDGDNLEPSNEGEYTKSLSYGKHSLSVKKPGYSEYAESFRTSFISTKRINVSLKELSAEEQANLIFETTSLDIISPRFFGNKSWLAFAVTPKYQESDDQFVVARYRQDKNDWEIVSSGTAIYMRGYANNAPPELIEYLRSEGVLAD